MNWLKEKLRAWLEVPAPHTTPDVQEMIAEAKVALRQRMEEAISYIRTDATNTLYSAIEVNEKIDAIAQAFGIVLVAGQDGPAAICPANKRTFTRTQKLVQAELELNEMRRLRNLAIQTEAELSRLMRSVRVKAEKVEAIHAH
jgi:hypothetical protein